MEIGCPQPGYAAVLVDVVDSRNHSPRTALQDALLEGIAETNEQMRQRCPDQVIDSFAVSVGDELQGTYATLEVGLRASVDLRLRLLVGGVEIRTGIGWGMIVVRDPARTPLGQDGPAWWSARAALDQVGSSNPWSTYAHRTAIAIANEDDSDTAAEASGVGLPPALPLRGGGPLLISYLALLDRSIALLDAEDAIVVLEDLQSTPTKEVAGMLNVSANAVSMRRSRNHLRELTVGLLALEQ